MTDPRPDPPLRAGELDTLLGYLTFHRETLRLKVAGLGADDLRRTHPPSTLTLGQLLKHAALNEHHWFGCVLHDRPLPEPFGSADWDSDVDWEMTSSADDSPEELLRLLDEASQATDRQITEAYERGGMEFLSARPDRRTQQAFSLRWIVIHMIEEYARHNGHADFLRESIDGSTGE